MKKVNALPTLTLESVGKGSVCLNGHAVFSTVPVMESPNNTAFLFDQVHEKHLDVSLLGIEKADSAGLALLIEWKAEAQRRGVDLCYKTIPEPLQAMALLCHLENILIDDANNVPPPKS